ncbi:MAG: cysteine hydrolase family protein, partial [Burkholderiaceae bacterium]
NVAAKPFTYRFDALSTALVMIDMQRDFIEDNGFGASLGNDVLLVQSIVPTAVQLLQWARTAGLLVVHTKECHRPDLSDLPRAKRERGNPSLRIGDVGPMGRLLVDGEPGSDFIEPLRPSPNEIVIAKPGKGAFYATNLHDQLQARSIRSLIFAGVTTEVCVQTSMREANDRGYECLLIEDATASYFPNFKQAAIDMMTAQSAIVGWSSGFATLRGAWDAAQRKEFA